MSLIAADLPPSSPPNCPLPALPVSFPPSICCSTRATNTGTVRPAFGDSYPSFVCLNVCMPACFCLSCRCVGRSSQLNESSRFARFGVLRRSPKARGTGSQSLQASMRPPPQPWNVLHYQPNLALRTTADGRSAPVPLPSLENSKGCYLVPVSWQQTQSARLRDEPSNPRCSDLCLLAAAPHLREPRTAASYQRLLHHPACLLAMSRGPGPRANTFSRQTRQGGMYPTESTLLQTPDRYGTGTAQLRLTSALKSPPGCEPSLGAQTPV